ncbi:hypothetical protein CL620_03015 [archaeon]|jgi:hypothetical protein|nr:hypothetical protein [archaeon]|tara:strand:+ start:545 stop:781 length:237 start_codon:yes stop_codon:yes gene_type:complete
MYLYLNVMLDNTKATCLYTGGWFTMRIEEQWFHEGVYGQQRRVLLVEDDMMSPEEDGFMQGYEDEMLFEEERMAGVEA